ncbi:MAG: YHS domain-containing (seleno)protein [Desulfobacterales bacterium]|jgi:YHS domain-containing protein
MKKRLAIKISVLLLTVPFIWTAAALAANDTPSTVAVSGYDVVAYHTKGKAIRGSGFHVATYQGVAYLFATKANRKAFQQAPQKYVPEFAGYCAYGAAVGKKFYADPTVWKIVDGKLYLNLDKEIQAKWESDLSGNLKKGYANWSKIRKDKPEGT